MKSLALNKPASTDNPAVTVSANKNKSFNFVVMTKKGNKTQYHNMEVPLVSDFANQFKAREEVYLFLTYFVADY